MKAEEIRKISDAFYRLKIAEELVTLKNVNVEKFIEKIHEAARMGKFSVIWNKDISIDELNKLKCLGFDIENNSFPYRSPSGHPFEVFDYLIKW